MKNYITTYLQEVKNICDLIDSNKIEEFSKIIHNIKGRLFIIGVGGSAANASHAVNDFRKILNIESYAVTDNVSELTARINDESWEISYANWLKGSNISNKDVVLVLSVGGGSDKTSLNLVRAMEYAKTRHTKIISIVSRDGGKAKELSDVCVMIPVIHEDKITPHAEEWQSIILHLVVSAVQQEKNKPKPSVEEALNSAMEAIDIDMKDARPATTFELMKIREKLFQILLDERDRVFREKISKKL